MSQPIYAEDFVRELEQLGARGLVPSENTIQQCAQVIRGGVLKNFDEAQAGDDGPWPARKGGGSHPLLVLSGAMASAATGTGPGHVERVSQDSIEVGLTKDAIPYAGVHQFGWNEKNIPARPYLTFREEELGICEEQIADDLMRQLAGGN